MSATLAQRRQRYQNAPARPAPALDAWRPEPAPAAPVEQPATPAARPVTLPTVAGVRYGYADGALLVDGVTQPAREG